jgi:hypothetical protein
MTSRGVKKGTGASTAPLLVALVISSAVFFADDEDDYVAGFDVDSALTVTAPHTFGMHDGLSHSATYIYQEKRL